MPWRTIGIDLGTTNSVVAVLEGGEPAVKKSEIFSTAADNQSDVEVHVLQGERPLAKDNRTLGRFHLGGLPLAPRGEPKVEVAFDVDANGIVNVSAKDQATGKEQAITITSSSGLSKEDVDRLVKEAQAHAEDDRTRREEIEARNEADAQAYRKRREVEAQPSRPAAANSSNVVDGEVVDAEPVESR